MFTKQDYQEYFEQIAAVERAMIYRLEDLLLILDDAVVRKPLDSMAKDETRHYMYIKKVFDSVLLREQTEKRRFVREHSLGRVKIKPVGKDAIIEGYCTDISAGGVGIELTHYAELPKDVELWIDLFDRSGTKHVVGKLAWMLQITPDLSMGKVVCKAGILFEK